MEPMRSMVSMSSPIAKTRCASAEPTLSRGDLNVALSTEEDVAADQEQE